MSSGNATAGNILLVANWESNVGYAWWLIENFWVAISGHFEREGRQCYLIYPAITQLPDAIAASGIRVEVLNFRDRSRANRRRLRGFIGRHGIRHIYLTDAPAWSPFYAWLRLCGVRRIVVHEHTPGERTLPPAWRRLFKQVIQRLPWITADHFIAVTGFVYRRFVEVACIPESRCSIAPNGIVPLDLEHADAGYAHRVFDIPRGRQIVVTTGRASYYKGIDFVIRCIEELVRRRGVADLHFLYCGDGPDLEDFRGLAARLQVEDHITFAGRRSDIRAILPSCDIGFHASRGEVGYSLSILEYMSAGLATVVPDLPSTSEATVHDDNGLVFRHGDISSACDMLERCLDGALRRRLAGNAVASVARHYNLARTNRELVRILAGQFS